MAEKVDQDVREAAAALMEDQKPLWHDHIQDIRDGNNDGNAIAQAFARMKAAGRQQGLREAVEVALSHMTCGCEGKHGYCSADSQPKSIADAIAALIEGEGK